MQLLGFFTAAKTKHIPIFNSLPTTFPLHHKNLFWDFKTQIDERVRRLWRRKIQCWKFSRSKSPP